MARMTSKMARDKTEKGVAEWAAYRALPTQQAKRQYFWRTWIVANPECMHHDSKKTFESENNDSTVRVDHGWVEREFVANAKSLKEWETNTSQNKRLEYYLSQLASKPHPCGEGKLYHFVEEKGQNVESNKTSLKLKERADLGKDEFNLMLEHAQSAMALEEPNACARRNSAGARNRRLSPPAASSGSAGTAESQKPAEPEWKTSFGKDLSAFLGAKGGAGTAANKVQEVLLDAEMHKDVLATNTLARGYAEELTKSVNVVNKFLSDVQTWKLKIGEAPSEAEAPEFSKMFQAKTAELKKHKEAFTKATSTKAKELKLLLEDHKSKKRKVT